MKVSCLCSLILILPFFLFSVNGQIEFDLYLGKPGGTSASKNEMKRTKKRDVGDALVQLYPDDDPWTLDDFQDYATSWYELDDSWTNDTVDLFKFMNGEYYGEIQVGSPAKKFNVQFDTTWADVYLPSSHCSWMEIACKLHNQYDSSKSSTYIANGTFVNVTNSELALEGILSTDTFHLGHIKVVNQTFLEATHMSRVPFAQYKADGVIGLAYVGQSGWKGVTPFFYNLVQQQAIKENVFTFYMNRDATTDRAGKVILGGRQRKHVKANTTTELNVIEKKFWKVKVDGIYAEQSKKLTTISENCEAIFDSSANTIVGPPDEIKKINYMLSAVFVPIVNKYAIKCRDYAKQPDFHFVLNGMHYIIQSKYYIQRAVISNIEACFSPFVASAEKDSKLWTLGGAFMMEFYTEFDMDKDMIYIGQTVF